MIYGLCRVEQGWISASIVAYHIIWLISHSFVYETENYAFSTFATIEVYFAWILAFGAIKQDAFWRNKISNQYLKMINENFLKRHKYVHFSESNGFLSFGCYFNL